MWEPVAIKVLRIDRFADIDRWKSRWAEQAEVLRFIRHPGVVGVREHFDGGGMHYRGERPPEPGGLYLTMNWVDGWTLRDWAPMHRTPDDSFEALRYLAQTGDVLDWLHSGQATPSGRPVIHADVTPNNIIVTPAGQAVLVDFGLVRLAAGLSHEIEGTGGYLAPEVKTAGAYSPSSDRYAFGAVTYFVLTGVPAPLGLAEIRAGLNSVASISAQPGSVDHLMRMFDPDPLARPPCGEWIRSFKVSGATFVDAGGQRFTAPLSPPTLVPVAQGGDSPTDPNRRSKRRRIGALLIGAVILGAAAIAFALTRGSDDRSTSSNTTPATATLTTTGTSTTAESTTTTLRESTTTAIATTTAPSTTAPTTTAAQTTTSSTPALVEPVDLLVDNTKYLVQPTSQPPFPMSPREADINGTHYKHAMMVVSNANGGGFPPELVKDIVYATDFDLGRKFSVFQARIGVTDQSLANVDVAVVVTADGAVVINQKLRLGQSLDAPINVTGVLRLHIEFTGLGTPDDPNKFVTPAIGGPTAS